MKHFLHARSTTSTTILSGTVDRLVIPGSDFANDHRYLVMYRANVGVEEGKTDVRLKHGGVEIPFSHGQRAAEASYPHHKEISGFFIIDGDDTKDLVLEAGHATNTARVGDEYMTAIDLDNGMVEGQDWWFTENDTTEIAFTGTFGDEAENSKLQFTADGISHYLVLGNIRFIAGWTSLSGFRHTEYRLWDQTSAAALVNVGQGSASSAEGVEYPKDMVMSVISAPDEGPYEIWSQYRGDSSGSYPSKDHDSLFVLRLNYFKQFGFFSGPIVGSPPAGELSDQVAGFAMTPDNTGDVVLLGDLKVQAEGGQGIMGRIHFDGLTHAQIVNQLGAWFAPSVLFNSTWSSVGPTFSRIISEQTPNLSNVAMFLRGSSDLNISYETATLVAFGTEPSAPFEFVEADLSVHVQDPPPAEPTKGYESFEGGAWTFTGDIKTEFTGDAALFSFEDEPYEDFIPEMRTVGLSVYLTATNIEIEATLDVSIT